MSDFQSWESQKKPKEKGKIKFPIFIHDVSGLTASNEILENVLFEPPKLKKTQITTINLNKKKNKGNGTQLF